MDRQGRRHITPYPAAHAATAVADADGDGRPDLVDGSFFEGECTNGLATRKERGVAMLFHSLPDGTVSGSDDVARRWAVAQCPSMPTTPLDAAGATCQRLWGRAPDAILKDASVVGPNSLCDELPGADRIAPLLQRPLPSRR
jgi:hypothetical protein